MKLPEIIIVGATKCGTTALWYNLDKHPDIFMAPKSKTSIEMHFWKSTSWKKGLDWYKTRFPTKKLAGEKSAAYFANKQAFKTMHKYIPDVKLIFCVRNPVDRAYSNFQMNKKARKVSVFNRNIFNQRYAAHGKYINFIERNILKHYPQDQLHICVTEHMKKNPTEEMRKVFEFIGVSDLGYPKKIIDGQLLKNRSRQEDIKLNQKEKFYRVWSKQPDKLVGPFRKELLNYYKPFNLRLFDYLGYNIKEWNK